MNESLLALLSAVQTLFDMSLLATLFLGVVFGLAIGAVPGIGGITGLALLLPFTFHLEPMAALSMLVAMHAVVATSDSIPAILFGVPGTVGSAATVVDGHKMAQRGEAGRALSAAFSASLLGGLVGAALLALAIPVLRPFVLNIGSPEMFALCVFGLSMAAALSGESVARGLAAVTAGLLLSLVGEDLQTGVPRLTFSMLYLWDGIPLVPLTLGLFAIPELAEFARDKSRLASARSQVFSGDWLQGMRDALAAPRVLLQSSVLGAALAALPGLGSAVIDWMAYGAAARMKLENHRFGAGDVRGVIASEAANNAKEGGALVPTIAFGVPGSAAMSILLGGFIIHGITPGPEMLTSRLDVTYLLVLSLVLANVIGVMLCLAAIPALARVPGLRPSMIVPVVCALVFVGAFQGSHGWGDIAVLTGAGLLGLAMKSSGWPRAPLLLGFVLGVLIERYLATSVQIYGAGFLARPLVAIILAATVFGLWRQLKRSRPGQRPTTRRSPDFWLTSLFFLCFAGVLLLSFAWPLAARLMPVTVCVVGLVFCSMLLVQARRMAGVPSEARKAASRTEGRESPFIIWLLLLVGIALIAGPLEGLVLWMVIYARAGFGASLTASVLQAALFYATCVLLFERVLGVRFPDALIGVV